MEGYPKALYSLSGKLVAMGECREYLHLLKTLYLSSLYPVSHLLSLCPLRLFPRWPEVSSAARISGSLSGPTCFAQSLYLETPVLGRKLNSLALQTGTMGLQKAGHSSLPRSVEGGEERSLMQTVYIFPSQHSSQTAVFIQS